MREATEPTRRGRWKRWESLQSEPVDADRSSRGADFVVRHLAPDVGGAWRTLRAKPRWLRLDRPDRRQRPEWTPSRPELTPSRPEWMPWRLGSRPWIPDRTAAPHEEGSDGEAHGRPPQGQSIGRGHLPTEVGQGFLSQTLTGAGPRAQRRKTGLAGIRGRQDSMRAEKPRR